MGTKNAYRTLAEKPFGRLGRRRDFLLIGIGCDIEMVGTGSRLCPLVSYSANGVKSSGSATVMLLKGSLFYAEFSAWR
jgi:hypothetical protein